MSLRIIIVALATFVAAPTFAQNAEELAVSAEDIIGRLDLDVPDSPGFAILGIAPQNVINPDTPAELATALFAGNDSNGNSQEGLAIEFRPYLMALGSDITVGDYYKNQWLSRTTLSLAESKGTSDADRTDRSAFGLTFTPIDERDPLTSSRVIGCLDEGRQQANDDPDGELLKQAVRDAVRKRVRAEAGTDDDALAVAQEQEDASESALAKWLSGDRKVLIEAFTDTCLNTFNKESINAKQLQIGVAFHDSKVESIDESGGAFWASYAMPLGRGSLIAHARYSENLVVADSENEGEYLVMDKSMLGLRYRQGDERRAVLFEASYVDESDTIGGLDDSYGTAIIGAEFRVLESLWIQFAIGETFGSNRDSDLALSGQFRWAASKTRLWNPNQ